MFNDLNNANSQGRAAVDDIFAETDKAQENNGLGGPNLSSPGIETKRVGLTSDEEISGGSDNPGNGKWFKIILIVIIATILILGGYLVYSKFFKSGEVEGEPVIVPKTEPAQTPVVKTEAPAAVGSFVEPTGSTVASTSAPEAIPSIPGVNAPATGTPEASTTPETVVPAAPVDSDSDGLTDAEEKTLGTNINIIDTDNDGLSDYEEVKIYRTNPLSADTDGDGYLDGAEVKGGYDPNGPGKLKK
jgi:hypothetical protein